MYSILKELMDPNEPKLWRPAVAVEEAHGRAGRVRVVSRTRDKVRGGSEHTPQPELRPNDGPWFSDEFWIGARRLIPGVVESRSVVVDEAPFTAVIEKCL